MRGLTVFWHHAGQRACKSILVTLTCGFLLRQPAIVGQSKASNLLKQWPRPSSLPLPPLVFTCWRSLRHNRTTLDRSLLESNPFSAFIHLQWPQQNVKSTSNAVFPPQRTHKNSGFQGSFIAVLISRTVFETTCFRPPADPTLSASALACCWLPTVETTGRQTSGLDTVHHHRKLSFTSCGPGRTRERRPVRTLLHTTGATSGGSGRRLRFLCNCLQMICTAV